MHHDRDGHQSEAPNGNQGRHQQTGLTRVLGITRGSLAGRRGRWTGRRLRVSGTGLRTTRRGPTGRYRAGRRLLRPEGLS